jgi:ribosomal protein L37AE/L43A
MITQDIHQSHTPQPHTPECALCGDQFPTARWALGYKWCKGCGETVAKSVTRTVVPMHKSNYFLCTNLDDLKGINNKGGLVR